jgi:hypothetical protein
MTETGLDHIKRSILRVGGGRGFVVQRDDGDPRIITAAHCLPEMPDPRPPGADGPYYDGLIGPLGEKPTTEARVVFVDPIADIAVLSGWREDYDALVKHPLTISVPPENGLVWGPAWVMSLTGEWIELEVRLCSDLTLDVANAGKAFASGMSGSPIVGVDGSAIGVVSGSTVRLVSIATESAPRVWDWKLGDDGDSQPCIAYCLPPRLGISPRRLKRPPSRKLPHDKSVAGTVPEPPV